jgi:cell division protein FtsB
LASGDLLFNYPVFEQPLSVTVNALRTENAALRAQNETLNQQVADLEMAMAALMGGVV